MSRRLLIVACAAIYIFLMLPLVVVFPISFSSAPYMQFPPPGFSVQWYERYLDDPQWIDATVRSLYIGAATAVLALALGVPLAFALARGRFAGRLLVDRLALAPLVVPTIILSVGLYGLFAKLKLIGEWYGLVAAHTVLALPFVVLNVSAVLYKLDRSLERAARSLGAGPLRTFATVMLPLLWPGIASGAIFAFLISFDEIVVAMFVSGSNPTLPKLMFDGIRYELNPVVAAVSSQLIAVTTLALLASAWLRRRTERITGGA